MSLPSFSRSTTNPYTLKSLSSSTRASKHSFWVSIFNPARASKKLCIVCFWFILPLLKRERRSSYTSEPTNCFPIPRTCSGRGFDKISSLTGMPKNSTGVFYKYMKGNMFNSQDGGVYFLRILPCILHACMIKSIWIVTRSYCISFPFLFSFFLFFSPISSTRKTVSWKMSALDIYSIILLIEILHMSTLISLNKKELYEEHVQNSYSDRKGSDKVYQGSYKKTCYLKLSLGRR